MHNLIDTRTLLIFITIILLTRAMLLGYVWHIEKQYPPVRYWALGSILAALGSLLIGLRDIAPSSISILLAQAVLLSGWLLIDGGIVVATERTPPWRLGTIMVGSAIACAAWFTLVMPDFALRTACTSLPTILFDAYALHACLQVREGRIAMTFRILAFALLVMATSNTIKVIETLHLDITTLSQPNPAFSQFLLVTIIFCVSTSVLFVLLASQRQQEALDREIAERISREESLRLAAMVYENSNEGMLVTDAEGRIITVNPAFTRLSGYSSTEAIGQTPRILKSGQETPEFYQAMWSSLKSTGRWHGEIWNRNKSGELRAEALSINTICDASGAPHLRVALYHDVTDQKKSAELVYHQANYDRLTGLPNRYYFFDHLSLELSRARRNNTLVALLFMDLNRFKPINDRFGHEAGDFVLKVVAERWLHCLRSSDTLARLGGDEFALIAAGVYSREEVRLIAEKLIQVLKPQITLPSGQICNVGTSVGIALYPENALEMDSIIKAADDAMYISKSTGDDQYAYSNTIADASISNSEWISLQEKHLVHIDIIDAQHRQLVLMVNTLNREIRNNCSLDQMKRQFEELIAYAEMHFETEEQLMSQYQYPESDSHRRQHAGLLTEIKEMFSRFESGDELHLLQTIKDWLFNHVMFEDKPLANYLISKGMT